MLYLLTNGVLTLVAWKRSASEAGFGNTIEPTAASALCSGSMELLLQRFCLHRLKCQWIVCGSVYFEWMSCFLDHSAPAKVTVCKSEDFQMTVCGILTPLNMRIILEPSTPVPREGIQDSESSFEGPTLYPRWLQEACGSEKDCLMELLVRWLLTCELHSCSYLYKTHLKPWGWDTGLPWCIVTMCLTGHASSRVWLLFGTRKKPGRDPLPRDTPK